MGRVASIILENLTYILENFSIRNVSLKVREGEYFVLLGPTGSGKTLLLELIAGFHVPDEGRIILNGVDVTYTPPEKRNVGFVYQDYSLFPHMTVEKNVAFGLRVRRMPENEIKRQVKEMMNLVGISHLSDRYPSTLSGGEQQRVAIARALAINPDVLLLDEPLSALDPGTREDLREELKRIQEAQNVTTIHVTHDRVEAILLADRIGLIINGEMIQVGSPEELFSKPLNEKAARFLGVENILQGRIRLNRGGMAVVEAGDLEIHAITKIKEGEVYVFIRPESIIISRKPLRSSARNIFQGRIVEMTNLGPLVSVKLDNGLKALITRQSAEDMRLKLGDMVYASFKTASVHVSRRAR